MSSTLPKNSPPNSPTADPPKSNFSDASPPKPTLPKPPRASTTMTNIHTPTHRPPTFHFTSSPPYNPDSPLPQISTPNSPLHLPRLYTPNPWAQHPSPSLPSPNPLLSPQDLNTPENLRYKPIKDRTPTPFPEHDRSSPMTVYGPATPSPALGAKIVGGEGETDSPVYDPRHPPTPIALSRKRGTGGERGLELFTESLLVGVDLSKGRGESGDVKDVVEGIKGLEVGSPVYVPTMGSLEYHPELASPVQKSELVSPAYRPEVGSPAYAPPGTRALVIKEEEGGEKEGISLKNLPLCRIPATADLPIREAKSIFSPSEKPPSPQWKDPLLGSLDISSAKTTEPANDIGTQTDTDMFEGLVEMVREADLEWYDGFCKEKIGESVGDIEVNERLKKLILGDDRIAQEVLQALKKDVKERKAANEGLKRENREKEREVEELKRKIRETHAATEELRERAAHAERNPKEEMTKVEEDEWEDMVEGDRDGVEGGETDKNEGHEVAEQEQEKMGEKPEEALTED